MTFLYIAVVLLVVFFFWAVLNNHEDIEPQEEDWMADKEVIEEFRKTYFPDKDEL